MLANHVLGFSLLALAAGFSWWHWRARIAAQHDNSTERERQFSRQQFKRRQQVSILLAMVGIAMILGAYLTDTRLAAGYFSGVALLVVWIALLALADWRGSRTHFETLRSDQAAEHAALRAELAKHLPAKQDD